MNSELTPNSSTECLMSERSVVGLKGGWPAGYIDKKHNHYRNQLMYSHSGVVSVATEQSIIAVPPQRALWIDAGMAHEVYCRSKVKLYVLYIDPAVITNERSPVHLIEVSEFLEALIIEVVKFNISAAMDKRQSLITKLLLREIWCMPDAPYKIRVPNDERLKAACKVVSDNPATKIGLDELANMVCMSRRAFTRLFKQETGISFGNWRKQMRLIEALSMIEAGHSVTMAAYDVGYSSPSAFSAAFRKSFGVSPAQCSKQGRDIY